MSMSIREAIAELRLLQARLDPEASERDADLHDAIHTVLHERAQLLEQLREQSKSFCTHCGQLFPKGKTGIANFRKHIAECNSHPLHPLANVLNAARVALDSCRTGILTGDGVRSPHFNSDADQFAAAWRDLRQAVDDANSP